MMVVERMSMWHVESMNGCLLPAFFAAAHGVGEPVFLPGLPEGAIVASYATTTAKALPGPVGENEYGTANFTVQWSASGVDTGFAEVVAEHLEDAWAALVVRDEWDAPMTSDSHKILVWLTPELAAPGLATGEPTEQFPTGQPIIYLNPDMLIDEAYLQQVVHHEFVHTTQFHLRDWYGGEPSEAWYWEASAEWLTEYVDPEANGQAWLSSFYADEPGLAYDTLNGGHEYAMFLLNAYLDEHRGGLRSLQSVWLENEGLDWLTELERVTGLAAPTLWSDFVGAYFTGQLRDAALYVTPEPVSSAGVIPGELGSMYIQLEDEEGEVVLASGEGTLVRDGEWVQFSGAAAIPEGEGDVVLVVTNPGTEPLEVTFFVRDEPPPYDTGLHDDDSGLLGDTGAEQAHEPAPSDAASEASGEEKPSGCSASPGGVGGPWPLILLGVRLRYGSRREFPRR